MNMTTTTAVGQCMKCTAQRDIKDTKHITLKNVRPAMEGSCAVCGTKMFKIGAAS